MIGNRFGMMTIVEDLGTNKNYHRRVIAQCDCGQIKNVLLGSLKTGKTKSCGCYNSSSAKDRMTKHGLAKHPLYGIWLGIKKRCFNKKEKSFPDYGGRGITMCDEWVNDFEMFFNWANENGYTKGLEIDRKDNNRSYMPSNCRFVTRMINANNKRSNKSIEYNGEKMNMSAWALKLNIPYDNLRYRIKAKWPISKAFQS